MKEITRIHIAKIAYDIELSAKKELETYINELELYAEDPELLQDIEIRITELLADRKVTKDGVITSDDVHAVREQLGEPQDFMGEQGDIAIGVSTQPREPVAATPSSARKLYRDTDGAIIGGVLGGVARFFRIDPIWVRLIFIVLLFASFGTALFVYIVAWIIIPPARTAAEKLQMSGQPVTLGSIRELNAQEEQFGEKHRVASVVRSVVLVAAGTMATLAAIGALFVTVWGAFDTGVNPLLSAYASTDSWLLWTALGLLVLAGLLLATLFSIFAWAAFRRTYGKRMAIATVAVIIAGVVSAGMAASFVALENQQMHDQIRRDSITSGGALPDMFTGVRQLRIDSNSKREGGTPVYASVEYIVSDTLRYEVVGLPGITPVFRAEGDIVVVGLNNAHRIASQYNTPVLRIFGPSLHYLEVESGNVSYTADQPQDKITVLTRQQQSRRYPGAHLTLLGGYQKVITKGGAIALEKSSIRDLVLEESDHHSVGYVSDITAGVVESLTVSMPRSCVITSYGVIEQNSIRVQAVSSGQMTYNGGVREAETTEMPCGVIAIGNGDEGEYEVSQIRDN